MDNASKALIMAGAILITMMLISLTIYTVTQIKEFSVASSTQTLATRRDAFNRFFVYSEPFGGATIKGSEVYNIICKAIDVNQGWSVEQIEIIFLGSDYTDRTQEEVKAIFTANDKEKLKLDNYHYEYEISSTTGVVNKVKFTN